MTTTALLAQLRESGATVQIERLPLVAGNRHRLVNLVTA